MDGLRVSNVMLPRCTLKNSFSKGVTSLHVHVIASFGINKIATGNQCTILWSVCIMGLIFKMVKQYISCEARTEFLNII
jgi:hypothetical protein